MRPPDLLRTIQSITFGVSIGLLSLAFVAWAPQNGFNDVHLGGASLFEVALRLSLLGIILLISVAHWANLRTGSSILGVSGLIASGTALTATALWIVVDAVSELDGGPPPAPVVSGIVITMLVALVASIVIGVVAVLRRGDAVPAGTAERNTAERAT